jgi:hypothetical protein
MSLSPRESEGLARRAGVYGSLLLVAVPGLSACGREAALSTDAIHSTQTSAAATPSTSCTSSTARTRSAWST